jgi:hypothetical protein
LQPVLIALDRAQNMFGLAMVIPMKWEYSDEATIEKSFSFD